MKQNLKICFGLVAAIYLLGCGRPSTEEIRVPDMKLGLDPKTEQLMSTLFTCSKSDAEQAVDQLDPRLAITLQDQIDTMKIESTDCDGKVTESYGPIKNFEKTITLKPDSTLAAPVNFIQVDNLKTCSAQRVDVTEEAQALLASSVNREGKIYLNLSDSNFKISEMYLNVADGNNVITIRYFGKCLKYNEKTNDKYKDAVNCLEAEELGKKQILIKLQIDRPKVDGVHKENTCSKK